MDLRQRVLDKRFWGVILGAFLLMLLYNTPVMASSILDEVDWERESTDIAGDYAEDIQYSLTKGNLFNYGRSTIAKVTSNKVGVSGTTMAHQFCDTLYLYLYLERKEGGTYDVYKYWNYTDTNLYELSRSLTVTVPSGYYYRVRGYHSAKDNGVKETKTTLTNGIYIG